MAGMADGRAQTLPRDTLPVAIAVLFILVEATQFRIPHLPPVAPALAMLAVFHWTVFRPETMPAWAAFLLGLLHDLVTAEPLGLSALVFVLLQGGCLSQRRWFVATSFPVGWALFGLIAFAAAFCVWALLSIYQQQVLDPLPAILRAAVTVAIYPPFSWALGRMERRLWAEG